MKSEYIPVLALAAIGESAKRGRRHDVGGAHCRIWRKPARNAPTRAPTDAPRTALSGAPQGRRCGVPA